jgi:hypothetical protein
MHFKQIEIITPVWFVFISISSSFGIKIFYQVVSNLHNVPKEHIILYSFIYKIIYILFYIVSLFYTREKSLGNMNSTLICFAIQF